MIDAIAVAPRAEFGRYPFPRIHTEPVAIDALDSRFAILAVWRLVLPVRNRDDFISEEICLAFLGSRV
jgi:hypothetical protein